MRPGVPLLVLLALCALAGVLPVVGLVPMWTWWVFVAVVAMAAAVDAWRLRILPTPGVSRQLVDVLPVGVPREVELELRSARTLRLELADLHPEGWQAEGLPLRLSLPGHGVARVRYRLVPAARGSFVFEGTHLRLHSPWRLWRALRTVGQPQQVRVYPDFAPLAKLALFSAEQASLLVGAHMRRRRGEGTDFRQMREYRVGDSLRQVDWKATARARKLISREYQEERNQQLLLVVDTGRRMLASEGGLSHFDHALNASLVVAWLALRQGDAVGLLATGAGHRWIPPRRGPGALQGLLNGSYDLQPEPVATDYLALADTLAARERRRALVMFCTNVRDEDSEDLLAAVRLLQRRHLVCVASLRERELDQALAAGVEDVHGAVRAAAAAAYLAQRAQAHEALRRQRVMTLDVTAADLPGALVERYLAVKRDGLL